MYKPLPQNDILECGILAGIIFGVNSVDRAHDYINLLTDTMFVNPRNKTIFNELKNSVFNDKLIGQPKTLSQLDGNIIAFYIENKIMEFHLEKSIADLKEVVLRREIISKGRELEDLAYQEEIHKDMLIENFNTAANEISGLKSVEKPTTMNVIKKAVLRVKEAMVGNENERVSYCHKSIDEKIVIFRKQIHTFGADQGGGKTALALDCLRRQIREGYNVVYFCTESSSDELLLRMIGSEIEIDMQSILTGNGISPAIMQRFESSINNFKKKHENFWILGLGDWDYTTSGANSILSKIMRDCGHVEMVYWDFLQDMHPPFASKNVDIIETIRLSMAGIKLITERHNFASTVLSQFRKDKTTHKPTKQDFWGASSIINASHIMSCLYCDIDNEMKEPLEDVPTWWYSVKTRLIKGWCKQLMFKGAHGKFYDIVQPSKYENADRPARKPYKEG